ncbi:hypothetical protein R4172_13680 [Rhodococcus kroppenstedtii]|uniref:hypothetical protein n=1 Tax=Rhodococcoides kroppenstedtii TaxID=293050 RepID=UPI00295572D2|nr:hypothetical protein [Rhodococcus kroppenstedtii]MDV7198607.1 hypothetical protein [Rhodococcus kroppenstedtii]
MTLWTKPEPSPDRFVPTVALHRSVNMSKDPLLRAVNFLASDCTTSSRSHGGGVRSA